MHIHLEHPRHGQKVAISEQEAQYDEANGWKRIQSKPPAQKGDTENKAKPEAKAEAKSKPNVEVKTELQKPRPEDNDGDEEVPAFLNELNLPKKASRKNPDPLE